ncbi:winged helix-turn-helix domain-containing protein [Halobacterium sp. R2-5]|uniref:winged helix-turn-helix domain-containing protein n=1 Tax=Halobacterium sp. R2-5 TaxID=2715751 RepID=UPI00142243D4|nr:winged helix-turn-helix domain-containing protein [Halobacterium sp. R2-5]NIC00367.1 winged helix-turn-helix transcriptional regulator [Halobacterium sp. R2-5]
MSQSSLPAGIRTDRDDPTTHTDADDVQDVLDALDDADCRDILEATRDATLTVGEISDACDLPQSTAYRKVDILADAGLLEESLRVRRSGKHVSEYDCGVEDVTLSVGQSGVALTVDHADTGADATFANSLAQTGVADD